MFAQVADEDELKTGVRREGAFFGINAMITKPAQSLALIIPALLLWITGFIPHELGTPPNLNQPAGVFLVIRLFFGLMPGILLLLGAFILQKYPLQGEYLEEVKKDILELHKEKEQKLKNSKI
jgi:GPH family glycoside/pentoside/hexuronide:cation symporter